MSNAAITKAESTGHRLKVAARPKFEAVAANVVCPNCRNAVLPRKAGTPEHCHYCGFVVKTGNFDASPKGYTV